MNVKIKKASPGLDQRNRLGRVLGEGFVGLRGSRDTNDLGRQFFEQSKEGRIGLNGLSRDPTSGLRWSWSIHGTLVTIKKEAPANCRGFGTITGGAGWITDQS